MKMWMNLELVFWLTCSYLFYVILDQQASKSWLSTVPPQQGTHISGTPGEVQWTTTVVIVIALVTPWDTKLYLNFLLISPIDNHLSSHDYLLFHNYLWKSTQNPILIILFLYLLFKKHFYVHELTKHPIIVR